MRLIAVALTVLALAASGCSGDDPEPTTTSESPSETPEATEETDDTEEPTEEPGQPAAADPCTLVTHTDVNAAYGVQVGPGEPGMGSHTDGDVSFTSTDCEWEAEDQLEVQLSVSDAQDFGGALACEPVTYLGEEGGPTKVPGAKSATWLASEDPNEVEARLRVCTSSVTMDFELDASTGTGVDELRKQTIGLATKAVAALG